MKVRGHKGNTGRGKQGGVVIIARAYKWRDGQSDTAGFCQPRLRLVQTRKLHISCAINSRDLRGSVVGDYVEETSSEHYDSHRRRWVLLHEYKPATPPVVSSKLPVGASCHTLMGHEESRRIENRTIHKTPKKGGERETAVFLPREPTAAFEICFDSRA